MNVLVLSAEASAINYIRSLRNRPDVKLFVTDCSRYASGLYEENVTAYVIPRARDLNKYQRAIDQIIENERIDILIPTSDYDMEGTMELIHRGWSPPVARFNPDYHVYRILSHKKEVMETLERMGFRVPKTYHSVDEIKFPAVIKPSREAGGKGVYVAANSQDLEKYRAVVDRHYGQDFVIQEYVPGETGSIHVALMLYGNDGQIYGEIVSRSSLTFMTWGGYGNAGQVIDEPKLLEFAKKIISSLGGWRGPINLEFKKHSENGHFYLMEVNCRLNGYSYLTTMTGLNFPSAVIDLLKKETTSYLSTDRADKEKNFIIGFREKVVEDWIDQSF